jgi:hypothetical protein
MTGYGDSSALSTTKLEGCIWAFLYEAYGVSKESDVF